MSGRRAMLQFILLGTVLFFGAVCGHPPRRRKVDKPVRQHG